MHQLASSSITASSRKGSISTRPSSSQWNVQLQHRHARRLQYCAAVDSSSSSSVVATTPFSIDIQGLQLSLGPEGNKRRILKSVDLQVCGDAYFKSQTVNKPDISSRRCHMPSAVSAIIR
jgi:hypothetical protein